MNPIVVPNAVATELHGGQARGLHIDIEKLTEGGRMSPHAREPHIVEWITSLFHEVDVHILP